MRLFDIAGIVFVAAWVITVGTFLLYGADDQGGGISLTDGDIELHEDTVWMTVHRDGGDIGIFREDRTRLIDGWLIEIQGVVELGLLNDTYAFRFASRSTLNEDLTLRNATGSIEAFGMHLRMHGQYREGDDQPHFHVTINLDDSSRQFVAELEERPRLASHAIPQMLATEELEEGVYFEQEFFDPLTLAPSDVRLVYEGREKISNAYFVEGYEAHVFGQSIGSFHSRIFTDDQGMVIRQVLPMQIAMARLPEPIGRANFEEFQGSFEDNSDKRPPFIGAIDTDDLLALVARFGGGELHRFRPADGDEILDFDEDEVPTRDSREFVISDLSEAGALDLESPRQGIPFQTSREARVEVGIDNALWHAGHAPANSEYEGTTSPDDHEIVAAFGDAIKADLSENARLIASSPAFDIWPQERLADLDWNPSAPWPDELPDEPTSAIESLAIFADALATAGYAPHFVHGIADRDGTLIPAVWIAIYADGEYLGEIDLLSADREVGTDHIQLYIDDQYRPDRLPGLLELVAPY